MTASSVPMPSALQGGETLVKPASHQGRIEEGDGGGTIGPEEGEQRDSQQPQHKSGRKRVRTVPPFAAYDPPSPVLSPTVQPTDAPRNSTTTTGHAASPSLSYTLSNLGPNAGGGAEYDPDDDMNAPQASWWTFARPGRWKQVQNLHNAWHEQMLANQELRMESEHLGRDYFASKRGSTVGIEQQELEETEHDSGRTRPPLGMSSSAMHSHMGSYFHLPIKLRRRSASNEDIRNAQQPQESSSRRSSLHGFPGILEPRGSVSAAATPPKVDTPSAPVSRSRRARFKAMSLPISRRQSADDSRPPSLHLPPFSKAPSAHPTADPLTGTSAPRRGQEVDGFVLGPPISGLVDGDDAASSMATVGTSRQSKFLGRPETAPSTPPRIVDSPQTSHPDLPASSNDVRPDSTASPAATTSPRRAHHPQLSITLPPPAFAPPPGTASHTHYAAGAAQHAPQPTQGVPMPPLFSQRVYQAQAPPTPLGWDAPWRERDHRRVRGIGQYHPQQQKDRSGQRDSGFDEGTVDPWLQPFEETAFEDGSGGGSRDGDSVGSVTGEAGRQRNSRGGVGGGSDSSGPPSGISEKSGRRLAGGGNTHRRRHRQQGQGGRTERALTKWAQLRRSAVKNPPGTRRAKLRKFFIFDARSTLYLRLLTLVGIAVALGIGCKLVVLEHQSDLDGILGSAPILSISYGSVSVIHCLVVMYREAFGKPIGLWGLRSKMVWVCLDLFFIALWSSDLSLTISDYMSTPLQCSTRNPWWTNKDYNLPIPDEISHSGQKNDMCNRQAALIAFVLFTLIMYVVNMVISLFRIFERLSTVAKSYEKSRVGQLV